MPAPLLADRCQVFFKPEAVPGTAETPAAADVILTTERPTWEPDIQMTPRNALTASPDSRGFVPGARMAKVTFKMYLRGTSAAPADPANLPDYVKAFRSCGLTCVVSGVNPNEITTTTPSGLGGVPITGTVGLMRDGKQYLVHGACGNVKYTAAVGSPQLLEFEFTGIYNAPTDVGLFSPTYPTVVEPPFLGATLSILGFTTAKIKTLTLDLGNRIAMRPQPNANGYFTACITGRDIKGTFDPEEEMAATKNWFAEWLAGTLGSIQTGTFPSAGSNYNQFSLTMP